MHCRNAWRVHIAVSEKARYESYTPVLGDGELHVVRLHAEDRQGTQHGDNHTGKVMLNRWIGACTIVVCLCGSLLSLIQNAGSGD